MSVQPVIGIGTIGSDSGLASIIADLRRRLGQMEAVRTSIGDGSLTGTQIAAGTIVGNNIAAGSIVAANIAAGTITSEYIAAGAIVAGLIAANAITASNIQAGTITGDRIQAGAITSTLLAANAVQAGSIQAGAITADKIASGAVTSDKITVTDLSAITSSLGNITAGLITGATFRTSGSGSRVVIDSGGLRGYGLDGVTKIFEIDAGSGVASFTGVANIDPLSVIPGGAIMEGTIGAAQIAAGSITANKIAAGAITATSLGIQFNGPNIIKNSGFEYGRYDDGVYSTEMGQWSPVDGNAAITTSEAWEGTRSARVFRDSIPITAYNGSGLTAANGAVRGSYGPGTYPYTLTAVRDGVELTGPTASTTVVLQRLDNILSETVTVTSTNVGSGVNHGGDRYYAVTAIGSTGETTLFEGTTVDVFGQRRSIPEPQALFGSPGARGSGTLPGGDYGFAAIAYGANGETTPSYTAPTVPTTRLARPNAPTKTSNTTSGTGLYAANWRFWLVAVDRNGVYDPVTGMTDAGTPLDVTVTGTDALTLRWSPSENPYAAAYMIFYQDLATTDLLSLGPFGTNAVNSFTFSEDYMGVDSSGTTQYSGVWGTPSSLPSDNTSVEFAYSISFHWTPHPSAAGYKLYSLNQSPGEHNPDGSEYRQTRLMGTTGTYNYAGASGWTGGTNPPNQNTTDLGGTTYNFSWPRQDGAELYRVYLVDAEYEPTQTGKFFEVAQPSSGAMVHFTDNGTQTHYLGTYPDDNTSEVWRGIALSWGRMDASYNIDSYRLYRGTAGRIADIPATNGSTYTFVDQAWLPATVGQQPPTSSVGFPGGIGNAVIANAYGVTYNVYGDADYVASAYFKGEPSTVGKRMYFAADFYDASNGYLSSMVAEGTLTTAWQRLSAKHHTPPGAHHANVFIGADALPAETGFYVDGVQLEKSQALSEYAPRWDDYIPGSIGPTIITPNSITVDQITTLGVTADWLNVSSLSAISADLGTITAGSINGTVITGATIRTAGAGQRIELDSSSMRFYDSFGGQQLTAFGSGIYTGTNFSGQRLQMTSAGIGGYNSSGQQQFLLDTLGNLVFTRQGSNWSSILIREGASTVGAMQFADYGANATSIRAYTSPGRAGAKTELLSAAGDWAGGSDNRYGTVATSYDASTGVVSSGASASQYARTVINNANRSSFVQVGGTGANLSISRMKVWKSGVSTWPAMGVGAYGDVTYTFPGIWFGEYTDWYCFSAYISGFAAMAWYTTSVSGDAMAVRYHNVGPAHGGFASVGYIMGDSENPGRGL